MQIVDGRPYLDEVRELIVEYVTWFGRDMAFQGLDEELANIEAKYCPPAGQLLAAVTDEGDVVGCIAYHALDQQTAEMKRLYVKPAGRGHNLGERLSREIMRLAKQDGYTRMVLDTVEPLKSAIAIYRRLGFQEIEPYYHNPFDDVIYMGIDL